MNDLFNNRYRIASTRLPGWDYGAGWYFITVCTHGRTPWLSTVTGDDVRLSSIGMIVADEWQRTAIVRPYVVLDAWVAMPDHFHAIIGIHPTDANAHNAGGDGMAGVAGVAGGDGIDGMDVIDVIDVETPRRGVSTVEPLPSPPPSPSSSSPGAVPTLRAGSLGAIVGQWKSVATKRIRADLCADFAWQPRFSDVIIRDAAMLARTRRYIAANPRRWAQRQG